jgi:hypothetical protein
MDSDKVTSCEPKVALPTTDQGMYAALVLDARLRQSLVTVRSLGSRGLRVTALETCDGLPVPAQAHLPLW